MIGPLGNIIPAVYGQNGDVAVCIHFIIIIQKKLREY